MTDKPMCEVCGQEITGRWVRHQRMNVYVCSECPLTDVHGEDISQHSLFFGGVE